MAKKQENFDVIISGGGLTGQVCALCLADFGLRVLVVDADKRESVLSAGYDGRASAIARASYNLFSAIGLADLFDEQAEPIWDIRVVDGHPTFGISPFFVHYDSGDDKEDPPRPFGHIIENRLLRRALQEKADGHANITVRDRDRITDSHADGGRRHVTLRSGAEYAAPLVIGAEGRFSTTRALIGIGTSQKHYRQTSIVCTVRHKEAHHGGVAVELFYPNGPFAMLPMTHNRSNVVWSEKTAAAGAFMALDDEDFLDALRLRFGDWLGDIELTGRRFSYPLSLLHAHHYTDERFALIGDSAHAIHPIAGQGVNLGFRDCAALAEAVAEAARLGLDIGSAEVLERYENWRRFDNQLLIAVTDGLVHLFSNDNAVIRTARNLGFAAVQNMPPLKRMIQKHAMGTLGESLEGLLGDLPRLLKGEPL